MIHFFFRKKSTNKLYHIDGELIVNEYGNFLVYSGNNTYCIDGNRFQIDTISDIYAHEEDFSEFKETCQWL